MHNEQSIKIEQPLFMHNIYSDVPVGKGVKKYSKTFGDVAQLYQNTTDIDASTLMYTVYSIEPGEPEQPGELCWGLTVMESVSINGECNMTRGHFHMNKKCAEFYFGVEGEGLLLLMDLNGQTHSEAITKGSLHYINGAYAHRIVNTGNVPLKVGACWCADSGHDYESIEHNDYPVRIYLDEGKIIMRGR